VEAFQEEPRGVLVSLEEDVFAGYVYNIWFPYTKSNIAKIKEGSFVAVKNFQGLTDNPKYSILEIVSALPVHYALGSTARDTERAYPGFVVEAAKAARQDWEQEEPLEQTTKIRSSAISTGLQIVFHGSECDPVPDESMPMIGEEVFLLKNATTNNIVNKGLTTTAVPHIAPCWLVQNREIKVCVSTEDLLRTHFGVFGFTGSGKSNLNSTVVHELSKTKGLKIVLFDLMLEYTGLLVDLLVHTQNAFILSLDVDSLPGGDSLEGVLRGNSQEENAIANITNTLLLPRELAPYRRLYRKCFKAMLDQNKFKVLAVGSALTAEILFNAISEGLPAPNLLGSAKNAVAEWLNMIEQLGDSPIGQDYVASLLHQVNDFIDNGIPESFNGSGNQPAAQGGLQSFMPPGTSAGTQPAQNRSVRRITLSQSARAYFLEAKRKLSVYIQPTEEYQLRAECNVSMTHLMRLLNDEDCSALIIVQSSRDDNLRQFSSALVANIFNDRRRRGANAPQVLFLYDEADEFMPSGTPPNPTYGSARAAITMLARRGRKFGLGLSFATQRVAYLETSVLAQAHTYMISKLPRQYDREAVSNAFGLSEDMLRRTLKFTKGQWLLVSYEATGLENVPLPVQFPNANTRIREFLEKFNQ
jgi:hypothetical protein